MSAHNFRKKTCTARPVWELGGCGFIEVFSRVVASLDGRHPFTNLQRSVRDVIA